MVSAGDIGDHHIAEDVKNARVNIQDAQAVALEDRTLLDKLKQKFLTLRVTPPAHPETMPRRVALIREVGEHTEEQRAWETVVPQEGEDGGGIGGGGGG